MRTLEEEKRLFNVLIEQVESQGGNCLASSIGLHEFQDGTSRGIVALKPIPMGTVLVEVPESCVLSKERVLKVKPLHKVFAKHKDLDEIDAVALFLMWVTHEDNIEQVDLLTRTHLQLMPEVETGLSALQQHMFWTEEELHEIRGTDAVHTADQLKLQVRADFGKLLANVLMSFPDLFPLDSARFTYKTYKWALAVIWSRAMDFLCPTSSTARKQTQVKFHRRLRAVVPVCDMFNTDFRGDVSHYYNADKDTVCLRATRDFAVGEQVFINYSQVPQAKMLQLYGFVVHPAPSFNSIQLWTVMDPSHPSFQSISEKLRAHFKGVFDPQQFPVLLTEKEPLPDQLLQTLNIQRGFEATEGKKNLTVLKELEAALLQRRSSYAGGSVEEEEASLNDAKGERKRIAIVLRAGEKRIIDRAIQKLRLIIQLKYASTSSPSEGEGEAEDLVPTETERAHLDELD